MTATATHKTATPVTRADARDLAWCERNAGAPMLCESCGTRGTFGESLLLSALVTAMLGADRFMVVCAECHMTAESLRLLAALGASVTGSAPDGTLLAVMPDDDGGALAD